jgi:hypothetical protein
MSRLSAIEPANAGIRLRGTIDALATQCGFARGMSTPMPQSRPALEIVMGSEERIAKSSTQRRGTRSLSPPRKTDAVATTRPCCSSLSPNPRRHGAPGDRSRARTGGPRGPKRRG